MKVANGAGHRAIRPLLDPAPVSSPDGILINEGRAKRPVTTAVLYLAHEQSDPREVALYHAVTALERLEAAGRRTPGATLSGEVARVRATLGRVEAALRAGT